VTQFEYIFVIPTARKILGKEWAKAMAGKKKGDRDSEQTSSQGSSCGRRNRQQPDPSASKTP